MIIDKEIRDKVDALYEAAVKENPRVLTGIATQVHVLTDMLLEFTHGENEEIPIPEALWVVWRAVTAAASMRRRSPRLYALMLAKTAAASMGAAMENVGVIEDDDPESAKHDLMDMSGMFDALINQEIEKLPTPPEGANGKPQPE